MSDLSPARRAPVRFDPEALYTALDKVRRTKRIHWRDIAREAGCSASTFVRLGHGHEVSATNLVRLMRWLGVNNVSQFASFEEVKDE